MQIRLINVVCLSHRCNYAITEPIYSISEYLCTHILLNPQQRKMLLKVFDSKYLTLLLSFLFIHLNRL